MYQICCLYVDSNMLVSRGTLVRKAGGHSVSSGRQQEEPIDERLKNIEQKMIELIMSEASLTSGAEYMIVTSCMGAFLLDCQAMLL